MIPLQPFDVITPLGHATCVGMIEIGEDDVEWLTWITATGECWFWRNPHIRRVAHVTGGRPGYSPFSKINEALHRQIIRYINGGWLPAAYDPGDVTTW
jgi:hypothetical protein